MQFSVVYLFSATFVAASLAAVLSKDDLGSTIWAAIEAATTCAACDAVLLLLKGIAELGDTAFVTTLTEICNLSGVDDADVCAGAIGLEGPIIAKDLREMSIQSHTSELFCIRFFGLCSYPAVTPYTVPFPSAKPSTQRPAVSGKTPLKIVHYSDIHVDPFYQTGANYNCTKPICCRAYTSTDAAGNNQFPAGEYGNSECDAPVSLEQSMYAAIQSIAPDAIASIFTGDIVDHAVWLTNETQNIKDINDAYARMSGLKQVFGTAGNHESSPANAFPPTARNVKDQQWVYDTLSADWSSFIGDSAETANNFGAYSSLVSGQNLRIISINTNLYFTENYWMYEKTMETDPSGQLAWLVQELQSAETAGERVYIIGHGPPGQSDAFHDGSNYINQIINRYSATIAALFFGHTHVDQFEIGYSSYSAQNYANALEVSYIAPSLTPTSGYPAFRVYSVDPVTFGVLDFTTYIADMTLTGQQTSAPVWKEYYSAKAAYGPLLTPPLTDPAAELTPAFWHNVTEVLASNATAFAEYYARKSRGFKTGTCTGDCTTAEICQMRAMESQYNCATITPGVHFSKRDEDGEGLKRGLGVIEKNVCEGSEMRRILARIVAEDGALEAGLERARVRYRKA